MARVTPHARAVHLAEGEGTACRQSGPDTATTLRGVSCKNCLRVPRNRLRRAIEALDSALDLPFGPVERDKLRKAAGALGRLVEALGTTPRPGPTWPGNVAMKPAERPSSVKVLRALRGGATTVKELSAELGLSKGRIQEVLYRLEKAGDVSRVIESGTPEWPLRQSWRANG